MKDIDLFGNGIGFLYVAYSPQKVAFTAEEMG
jgi:hypothetical protein